MIFVDTNVIMYAVGRRHPLQDEVRTRFRASPVGTLVTSAEVMQELLHAYLPVGREDDLDAAYRLIGDRMLVRDVTEDIVRMSRHLADRHPGLAARDLVHLATCLVDGVQECWTYDRGLRSAYHH